MKSSEGPLASTWLLLRPYPYRWVSDRTAQSYELTIRGETVARIMLVTFIVIGIVSFIAFYVFLPPPGVVGSIIVLGVPMIGVAFAACRMLRRRRVIFNGRDKYVLLVNHGWHGLGTARYDIDRVWIEVRPLVVSPNNMFQKTQEGFALLLRTPIEFIALCAEPEFDVVQQMAFDIQKTCVIRLEYNEYEIFAGRT